MTRNTRRADRLQPSRPSPPIPNPPSKRALPQRWAINPWGETIWTFMAMWAPEQLQQLSAATRAASSTKAPPHATTLLRPLRLPREYSRPHLALMFHELGCCIQANVNPAPPPPHQQRWRLSHSPPQPLAIGEEIEPIVAPDHGRTSPAAQAPPQNLLPSTLSFEDLPPPHDPGNVLLREWSQTQAIVSHVLELMWLADPHQTLKPLLPIEAQSLFEDQTQPAPEPLDAQEVEAEARTMEDLEAAFSTMRNPWTTATAAWQATLAIRYSPEETLSTSLRETLLAELLHTPVPTHDLPPLPSAAMEAADRLPSPPEALLSAYTALLPAS